MSVCINKWEYRPYNKQRGGKKSNKIHSWEPGAERLYVILCIGTLEIDQRRRLSGQTGQPGLHSSST